MGDATKEMGPFQSIKYGTQTRNIGSWYDDESLLAPSGTPWVKRGHAYHGGTGAGLFTFSDDFGRAWVVGTFRLVLAI